MIQPGGRGFESAFAPYFVGAMIAAAVLVWVIHLGNLRRWKREEEEARKKRRDSSDGET